MEQTSVEVETAFSRSPYEPTMAMEETGDAVNDAPHLHSAPSRSPSSLLAQAPQAAQGSRSCDSRQISLHDRTIFGFSSRKGPDLGWGEARQGRGQRSRTYH